MAAKMMAAKFPGVCELCGVSFPKGERISYNGRASHVACIEEATETDRMEDAERDAKQAEWLVKRNAGEFITTRYTDREIFVYGAPNYRMARDEAWCFVCSVRAAGGTARLITKVRGGKRYCGREVVSQYGMNMSYHEGWSFGYSLEVKNGS